MNQLVLAHVVKRSLAIHHIGTITAKKGTFYSLLSFPNFTAQLRGSHS